MTAIAIVQMVYYTFVDHIFYTMYYFIDHTKTVSMQSHKQY